MTYEPHRLLDALRIKLDAKSDAQLAKALDIPKSSVSRMRSGKIPIYPALLLRMHDVSGISITEMQTIVGDRRSKFRFGHTTSKKRLTSPVS